MFAKPAMNSKNLIYAFGCFVLSLACSFSEVWGGNGSNKCEYPAIYNFGDSNSDTGAVSAAFTTVQPPNGESFFGILSGRACDGRLIIDFIAEELELPYLSAYLNSVGSNYRHGANFATGGSSIRRGGYSPFHLGLQVSQFKLFKSRTNVLFNQLSDNKEQVRASIPDILNQFSQAVLQLYNEGARVFWIHNTGPIGCLPYTFINYKAKQGNLDANGCVKPQNDIAQEFNRQLKDLVFQLRKNLPLGKFTYVDVYSAKYQLISIAINQGFVKPLEFCCGSYYGYHINCGKKAVVNGTVYGNPCKNPSQHVSWDGIHYSQAANLWITQHILHGNFSNPPVPISQACY